MLRGSIAEAADRRLLRRLRSATTTTTTSTPSALLLLVVDRASFDALQWSCPASATAASGSSTPGGLAALLGAGADANAVARVLFIEDLDTRPAALPDLAADLAASLSASPATATPANHAVFLLSSHLARHADAVRAVLLAHPFAACSVFATALSELAHAHELERDTDLLSAFDAYLGVPAAGYFAGVESKLYEWMVEGGGGARVGPAAARGGRPRFDDGEDDDLDNPYAGGGDGDFDVLVTHLPLFSVATITNDLFTIPSSETVFPSLHAPNLAARSLDAPSSFDRQTRQLAYTLSTLLDDLSLKDELFVLGNYSKSIARCMVAQSLHSPRRKSDRGAAVILIDRTLDLAAPLAHSDNLLDHINRLLEHRSFGQSFDVDVPLDLLRADAEDSLGQIYASLAHGADSEALDLLTVLSTLSQKDGLVVVRKRLVDLLIRVRPDLTASRPRVLGKLTLAQLEGFLKSVRGDEAVLARHGPMLQCVAAAAAAMRAGQSSRWEDLMGIEKLIGLTLSECLDGSNIIAPVLDVLSQVDVATEITLRTPPRSPGQVLRSPYQTSSALSTSSSSAASAVSPPSMQRSSSSHDPQQQQQPPFSISDALKLLAFSFSLAGPDVPFDAEDRATLTRALVRALSAGAGGGVGSAGVQKLEIDMWITECLERLNEISRTRAALLPEYRSLLSESSPIGYVSLVRRVLSNALAPDAQAAGTQTAAANAAASGALDAASGGLSHVSYGGTLGSVISGFSRLLGGARPTPASFGTVIVFAVGGITVGEVRDLKEVAKERGVKLLVGSTAVIDGNVIMRNLFPPIPGL